MIRVVDEVCRYGLGDVIVRVLGRMTYPRTAVHRSPNQSLDIIAVCALSRTARYASYRLGYEVFALYAATVD